MNIKESIRPIKYLESNAAFEIRKSYLGNRNSYRRIENSCLTKAKSTPGMWKSSNQ